MRFASLLGRVHQAGFARPHGRHRKDSDSLTAEATGTPRARDPTSQPGFPAHADEHETWDGREQDARLLFI